MTTKSHPKRLAFCALVAIPIAIAISVLILPDMDSNSIPAGSHGGAKFDPAPLKAVLADRQGLDSTLWAPEQQALAHENLFVQLWDHLRADDDTARVLKGFPFESLTFGDLVKTSAEQNDIVTHAIHRNPRTIAAPDFCRMVTAWQDAGYQLKQSEWHHESFQRQQDGRYVSTIQVTLHIEATQESERVDITGPLIVTWTGRVQGGLPIPANIDARGLVVATRRGNDAFAVHFNHPLETIQTESTYSDVLACDLDGDGLSELAYPRTNLLFRNLGNGDYAKESLCEQPLEGICDGLLVDFTGDGITDLLVAAVNAAGTSRAIYVYQADQGGKFSAVPRQLTDVDLELPSPDSMTVGDIDADGDLDIFATQYHAPYRDGKMPSPYYDANDGLPAFLFLNEGDGQLRDVTVVRGISAKRRRRAYRSSLVDLDGDGDLDLLVTSDFSGVDVYENDGRGFFRDVTDLWFDERTLFGMSHVVTDINNDSQLDLYVTGMASTTARRLDSLGLFREDIPDDRLRRAKLAHGNRLYFGQPGPRFVEGPTSADVVRAGWSWGCAAFDVENDGDVDLYVANGHLSGKSAADYCTRFWCHDIYVGHHETPGFEDLVRRNSMQLGATVSWNGYEKNRLFLNRPSRGFFNAGFLMDVAMEEDSRSVLADDLNGDGRMDLLVGFADRGTQRPQYVLRGLLNQWPSQNHWIGVRLVNAPGAMLVGARVAVQTSTGRRVGTVIVGESFSSQLAPIVHFGLRDIAVVDSIEVHWLGGKTSLVRDPGVDQYHAIAP